MTTGLDFATFYTATWSRLLRTTYAVAGDRQLAEDALQSGFAHAYASWHRVGAADDPVAYVRRIAVNAALGHRRKAFRRREIATDVVPDTTTGVSDTEGLGVRDELWTAVRALPPRQRAVVVLRYYEDLSEAQIAEVLGCRPGTVKSQASAALTTLRAALHEPATEPAPEGEHR